MFTHGALRSSLVSREKPLRAREGTDNKVNPHTAILRKFVRRSAHYNPKRCCGWFWVHCSSLDKEIWENGTRGHRQGKATTEDSTATVSNSVLIISHIFLSLLSHAPFFPTTFLEIAVWFRTWESLVGGECAHHCASLTQGRILKIPTVKIN